jgi:hypothetical protein
MALYAVVAFIVVLSLVTELGGAGTSLLHHRVLLRTSIAALGFGC